MAAVHKAERITGMNKRELLEQAALLIRVGSVENDAEKLQEGYRLLKILKQDPKDALHIFDAIEASATVALNVGRD